LGLSCPEVDTLSSTSANVSPGPGLQTLVRMLSSEDLMLDEDRRVGNLHRLIKIVRAASSLDPIENVPAFAASILVIFLEALRDSESDRVRYLAARGITELARSETDRPTGSHPRVGRGESQVFESHLVPVLCKLLSCADDEAYHVVTRTEEAFLAVLETRGADKALSIIVDLLRTALAAGGGPEVTHELPDQGEGPGEGEGEGVEVYSRAKILLLLRGAVHFVKLANSGTVFSAANSLAQKDVLSALLTHDQLELRKEAVDLCVVLYDVVEDRLLPLLADLPPDRLKLITMYVQKKSGKR